MEQLCRRNTEKRHEGGHHGREQEEEARVLKVPSSEYLSTLDGPDSFAGEYDQHEPDHGRSREL